VSPHMQAVAAQEGSRLRFPWPAAPAPGQVREVAAGIFWLRMPLPLGLDHINLYLLRDGPGWVVVDTGLDTAKARAVWEEVFAQVLGGQPVRAVVCTHFHHDHSGLAHWLCEHFHCPLYMSTGEYQALSITAPKGQDMEQAFCQFHRRAGLNDAQIAAMLMSVQNGHFQVRCPPEYQCLREGMRLEIGGRQWQVVIGAGHSPEHACLYCQDDALLISGDQVLPRITSCVCVGALEPEADPLREWLDSIERLRGIPDEVLVLPAHELPFHGLHPRLEQLQRHHHDHLDDLIERLQGAEPETAAGLRPVLFPAIKSDFDLLMALGETLAHLHFLVAQGQLQRTLAHEVYRFGAGEVKHRPQPLC